MQWIVRHRRLVHSILVLALLLGLMPLQLLPKPVVQHAAATGSPDIHYVYDDLGRLEAVTDPS